MREQDTSDLQDHLDVILCTHEDDGNQAVCWCQECRDVLCRQCQIVHSKANGTKNHVVLDLRGLGLKDVQMERQTSFQTASACIANDYISETSKDVSHNDMIELMSMFEKYQISKSLISSREATSDVVHKFHAEVNEGHTDADWKTQIETLKKELQQSKLVAETLLLEKEKPKRGFAGFISWMLRVIKTLVIFIGMVAMAVILTSILEQHESDAMTDVLDKSYLLNRTHVEFSRKRYNNDKVHINNDGQLVNWVRPSPQQSKERLTIYHGTSSTGPLPRCESPQYYEVKSKVVLTKALSEGTLLLEIALAREEEQDLAHCTNRLTWSYSLVIHSTTHGHISTAVWRHGKELLKLPGTLKNTPGSTATLHHGVAYDSARRSISFLDVEKNDIVGRIENVDSTADLWPMFGVFNPRVATANMSLVVGRDIDMSETKRALILKSLS